MLHLPLAEITEAYLQQICSEQWPESQTLEFKATLPGNDEAARDEFRKDVSAMANADGGDLVFGISTKDDKAQTVLGHAESADAVKRRLQQILESRVEPRINGIQYFNCPLSDAKHVLVLRIPSSFHGPHRIGPSTAHRFVYRDNSKITDMSYDHLRSAFGQAAAFTEKVESFHTQRLQRITAQRTPKRFTGGPAAVVHVVPINGIAGKIALDVPTLKNEHELFRIDRDYVWHREPNLDGLVLYPYADQAGVDWYSQVFRNGAFESVRAVGYSLEDEVLAAVGTWTGNLLRNCITAFSSAACRLGISGRATVLVSVVQVRGTVLCTNYRNGRTRIPQEEDSLHLPAGWIDDISAPIDLDTLTRPILDVLYQAYGATGCSLFTTDGKWIER